MTSNQKLQGSKPLTEPILPITVRPIRPDDLDLLQEMHQRLSPESIYYRYLQMRIPSPEELRAVCQMGSDKGAGFVATVQAGSERIVGVAYYVREAIKGPPSAEPGILVEDQFQGHRVGRRLWQQLHHHAKANQIRQLRVLFEPSNWRVLRLLQGSGFSYQINDSDWMNEYIVVLDETSFSTRWQGFLKGLGSLFPSSRSVSSPALTCSASEYQLVFFTNRLRMKFLEKFASSQFEIQKQERIMLPDPMYASAQLRMQAYLQEADERRLLKSAARLDQSTSPVSQFRLWLGNQLVKWGARLQRNPAASMSQFPKKKPIVVIHAGKSRDASTNLTKGGDEQWIFR